jgi:hypothetical protein
VTYNVKGRFGRAETGGEQRRIIKQSNYYGFVMKSLVRAANGSITWERVIVAAIGSFSGSKYWTGRGEKFGLTKEILGQPMGTEPVWSPRLYDPIKWNDPHIFCQPGRNLWFSHIYGSKDMSWSRPELPESLDSREQISHLIDLQSSIAFRKMWPKLMRIAHKSIPSYRYLFIRRSEWVNIYAEQTVSNAGKTESILIESQCCILKKLA